MTKKQATKFERLNNCYVDIKEELYNFQGHNAVYGWIPIPKKYLLKNKGVKNNKTSSKTLKRKL